MRHSMKANEIGKTIDSKIKELQLSQEKKSMMNGFKNKFQSLVRNK